ncbi:MAG: type II secretion system inner membrane protein GspF [Thiotrichaceae bacterium]|nr:type II secretion system inner membrane protein GspF [Thiotrichaceae bacterium]
MGAFEYKALDRRGRERKGVLEGDTARQVRQQLRDQGMAPLEVVEVVAREKRAGGRPASFQRGVNATDLALITRQLSTLVQSGLPIEEALRAVSQQCEKPRLKSMLVGVRSKVMEGHTLATALGDFPHVFNDLYRATVSAGEQSGHLDVVLDRLADYTETRQQMRQEIMQALIYPVVLVVVSIAVVSLLLAFVVPEVVKVFDDMGQELPTLTVVMIATSDFIRESGLLLLGVIVVSFIAMKAILRKPGPKRWYHHLQLKIPLISKLVRGANAARFARTLSILSQSGVPVLEALRIAEQVVTNIPMRSAVEAAAKHVSEGASMHKALEKSGYFPPMTIHLIASGESSGRLDEMLARAADSQELELNAVMKIVMGVFGPLIILVMGGAVMLIILAILLPIFNMNELMI